MIVVVVVRAGPATQAVCVWAEPCTVEESPLIALLTEGAHTDQRMPGILDQHVPFPKLGYAVASLTPS